MALATVASGGGCYCCGAAGSGGGERGPGASAFKGRGGGLREGAGCMSASDTAAARRTSGLHP